MIRPKLRLTFNIIIGILALTYIVLVIFSDFTNNIWFTVFLFIIMILHILKAIFAPKKNRSDEYRNY
jgi:type II secretory pathway component PulF